MKNVFCALTLTLAATTALADTLPGYDRLDIDAAHRARLVAGSIWYPAGGVNYVVPIGDGPIFEPTRAIFGAAVAEGRHPLVLLSHGSGGNADSLGWLSAGLVSHGAIVLAVNHPGSTSGDSSAWRSVDMGARAGDLSAALDQVLADPAFAASIDVDRIYAVGFSLGGATALGLGGARLDAEVQQANCTHNPQAADCWFFLRRGVDFSQAQGFDVDMRDERVSRVVAVDPGFIGALNAENLADMAQVHLVNLGEGADLIAAANAGPDGHDLVTRIAGTTYSVFAPANHFSFLAPCKPGAAEILAEEDDDPICADPPGTDRPALHQALIADIAGALGL
ncbi:MAG: hypothetical protein Q4G22_10890 [Paracoccus sp. (in: a-proteobacteria)]|uniref:alpha/beta hydrolase family protein n=1 Tax=Paracoccus sp. TaxID=267 RepID=UPI0026E0F190|nr:hypothetical protein [Paracoccus sp. (in: a-proteobacteria)]MDO5632331.1 hypothetical protein [Paracoccus sp. (in: a-proteobacteria)]